MHNRLSFFSSCRLSSIFAPHFGARGSSWRHQRDLRQHLLRQRGLGHQDDGKLSGTGGLQHRHHGLPQQAQVRKRQTGLGKMLSFYFFCPASRSMFETQVTFYSLKLSNVGRVLGWEPDWELLVLLALVQILLLLRRKLKVPVQPPPPRWLYQVESFQMVRWTSVE